MFHSARIKLTLWYLLIIMAISLLFSVVIYQSASTEFRRFENMQHRITKDFERKFAPFPPGQGRGQNFILFTNKDAEEIKEARERFILMLGFINVSILVIAGTAGYFLAGRTLKPIQEMMEEQKRFISDSSHELRTPLTTLRTEIEVALRSKKLSSEQASKILRSNLEEVISLQMLSNNLLQLAQNGKLVNRDLVEVISINTVINDAIRKTEKIAKSKQIKIKNNVTDIKIKGVQDRLTEVFVILLDNSIKYSKNKERIEISSRKTDGKVKISVTDHGMGISKKDLPHIFERFYRSDQSRSEKGYGLGLSIAKKIVESHNGSISVKSELGKHTTFVVNLTIS
ncbi:MAG: GHKL domain-containing protein [Candidatus Levybacteria bacterium]|nr:GHKL domain-containing protein [Candidatus Levybacteria bacterium]